MRLNSIVFLLLLVVLCFYPALVDTADVALVADNTALGCGALGDCLSSPADCEEICGCDRAYHYNETTQECDLDVKHLVKVLFKSYNTGDHHNYIEEGMAKKIQMESDNVYKGIIIIVLLFITCAILCVLSACVYCIRMKYTDCILRNDVVALAKKLRRDQNITKSVVKPKRLPKEESCNIMVESAGIFVV